ncbi:MAG: magnesium chelatase [Candidatus Vogelbacteria bacterium CG10_big_fil_rev_8_21_14_0_10_49_38]|uniref:Magnesium chelatase n=1 Tax=Candidatus Vogelbacteria bacterium CG10_big_fil_rev_8_21_14_0_10_49_38 TaxID=1975043 RepID=A0A2H0RH12_9BACT|nr:MAG: magnesium chelatase [bacterium CG10_49_38]PIR45720.1 MAG: magnesium chelatase [Candidatus Vogelbacteria bacterium CG10_big_fil_rev_8_21_14_0_10_49_38]
MVSKINSAQIVGLKTDIVEVEVDINRGLQSFNIVGLPDKAVAEAKDRINAAIKNSGFPPPQKGNKKVIVSLAPANLRKEGATFDLGIALGYLLAAKEIRFNPMGKMFIGELALDGSLRPIAGALLIAQRAQTKNFQELYLPVTNAAEAALVRGLKIFPCRSLKEITDFLSPKPTTAKEVSAPSGLLQPMPPTEIVAKTRSAIFDFAEIRGQHTAKRGLEIAAAGGHNVAMFGPPGTGKTMLAKAFASIVPPLLIEEIIEVTGIHSAAGLTGGEPILEVPFRAPHHTASYVSLVGGGAWPKPGEITMAHRGILFLDEFPEFDKKVIEALRQPLEDRVISVARARGSMIFPANFILIAALNPCPCGWRGSRVRECVCPPAQIQKYSRKISGPIIDRIDLWLDVPQIDHRELSSDKPDGESSQKIRERVMTARQIQAERFKDSTLVGTNGQMGLREIKRHAPLADETTELLNASAKRLNLSARAYHRIIKLSRTIADLEGAPQIKDEHLLEALQYRPKNIFE